MLMVAALVACACAAPASRADTLPVAAARIVRIFPHDPTAFTEGLLFTNGHLYESTGFEGRSFIREEDVLTGRVLRQARLAPNLFGEGIAAIRNTLLSVTWHAGVGFRWRLDTLTPLGGRSGQFTYPGEGWGMTTIDGRIVLSDGTPTLRFVDPADFRVVRRVEVHAGGEPVFNVNELEYVNGEILANVWMTDRIARIDPATGAVRGWIDLADLVRRIGPHGRDDVPNGIAYDPKGKHLYVTGKDWPALFEIALPPGL